MSSFAMVNIQLQVLFSIMQCLQQAQYSTYQGFLPTAKWGYSKDYFQTAGTLSENLFN
jgi:hypothetical protein